MMVFTILLKTYLVFFIPVIIEITIFFVFSLFPSALCVFISIIGVKILLEFLVISTLAVISAVVIS